MRALLTGKSGFLVLVALCAACPSPSARADEAVCKALIESGKSMYAKASKERAKLVQERSRTIARTAAGARRFFKSLSPAERTVIKQAQTDQYGRVETAAMHIARDILGEKARAAFAPCANAEMGPLECLTGRNTRELSGIISYNYYDGYTVFGLTIYDRRVMPALEAVIPVGDGDLARFEMLLKDYLAPLPPFDEYAANELKIDQECLHPPKNSSSETSETKDLKDPLSPRTAGTSPNAAFSSGRIPNIN
ncbi:MAG: hypothetical protein HY074_03845 [Deltaproteobacteria bacterium]|nr:hypothetical protein [Deltaproteobacteria bacterium]